MSQEALLRCESRTRDAFGFDLTLLIALVNLGNIRISRDTSSEVTRYVRLHNYHLRSYKAL